jgi:hypothetical protein
VTSADHLAVFPNEAAARVKADELGLSQDDVSVSPKVIIPETFTPALSQRRA